MTGFEARVGMAHCCWVNLGNFREGRREMRNQQGNDLDAAKFQILENRACLFWKNERDKIFKVAPVISFQFTLVERFE